MDWAENMERQCSFPVTQTQYTSPHLTSHTVTHKLNALLHKSPPKFEIIFGRKQRKAVLISVIHTNTIQIIITYLLK